MFLRVVRLLSAAGRAMRLLTHLLGAGLIACAYPALASATQQRIVQTWSHQLLKILRVRLNVQGRSAPGARCGHLVVANHISWLDVFVINARLPARFVAKSEVGQWPVLGWLVQRTGALFIRRGRPRDAARVTRAMATLLQQGDRVALFPQGTSHTGGQAVHFHAPLLQSAIDARAPIQAIAIHYHDAQGRRRDDAGFTGDMNLLHSLWKVLCGSGLQVTLTFLAPVDATDLSRRELTLRLQQLINTRLAQFDTQPEWRPPPRSPG